jgi:hypothetical protein
MRTKAKKVNVLDVDPRNRNIPCCSERHVQQIGQSEIRYWTGKLGWDPWDPAPPWLPQTHLPLGASN